jgi:hypothetical protein
LQYVVPLEHFGEQLPLRHSSLSAQQVPKQHSRGEGQKLAQLPVAELHTWQAETLHPPSGTPPAVSVLQLQVANPV